MLGKIIKFGLLGLLASGLAGGGFLFAKEFSEFKRERKIEKNFMATKSDKCPHGQYYMGACREKSSEMKTILGKIWKRTIPF